MHDIVSKVSSCIDNVTKYVLYDYHYGKNEASVIIKDNKNIIVLPTQTNCSMGCKFCHLTGTTRPVDNLSKNWISKAVELLYEAESLNDKPLLVSFMGAGEPLININNILLGIEQISSSIKNVKFAISTIMPSTDVMFKISEWQVATKIPLKMHLSVHGISNRKKIIKAGVSIESAIAHMQNYSHRTLQPIEYHYTLVDSVNDSTQELLEFKKLISVQRDDNYTVKFLTLSEYGGCLTSKAVKDNIIDIFSGITVEFYDPPGRDVGSSCGMFDKSIYNV